MSLCFSKSLKCQGGQERGKFEVDLRVNEERGDSEKLYGWHTNSTCMQFFPATQSFTHKKHYRTPYNCKLRRTGSILKLASLVCVSE